MNKRVALRRTAARVCLAVVGCLAFAGLAEGQSPGLVRPGAVAEGDGVLNVTVDPDAYRNVVSKPYAVVPGFLPGRPSRHPSRRPARRRAG